MGKRTADHARTASEALSNLNIYEAVIKLLEGGTFYGHSSANGQIERICKREQQRWLRKYDEAMAVIQYKELGR